MCGTPHLSMRISAFLYRPATRRVSVAASLAGRAPATWLHNRLEARPARVVSVLTSLVSIFVFCGDNTLQGMLLQRPFDMLAHQLGGVCQTCLQSRDDVRIAFVC